MREQIEQRLRELKTDFESAQKMIADLEARQTNLEGTLLQISGAIQVLEELLQQEKPRPNISEKSEESEPKTVASR